MDNPEYWPDFKIDGDRSIQKVINQIPFRNRVKSLLFHNSESNQNSKIHFPFSKDENIFPFILTREIGPVEFAQLHAYCKKNHVTMNDVFLGAYYRALFQELHMDSAALHIPIMVDMRRYLKDNRFDTLSNISSTIIMDVPVNALESFNDTVLKIGRETRIKKSTDIGVNGFLKLDLVFKLLNNKLSYRVAKNVLKNPLICMTNTGILDEKRLVFKGTTIVNAFVCGSIKYRPHFQIALSTYADTLTISSNLYGSHQDYDMITHFLSVVEEQLPISK